MVAVYIPIVVLVALGAAITMDNLTVACDAKGAMRRVCRDGDTWIIALLYIGTFGSFIGFGFAFGQVLQVQFKDTFTTPVKAVYLTFLGPLLGSLIRPYGGKLADRFGGSKVSAYNFMAMALGAALVLAAALAKSLPLYLIGFILFFIFSGLGNGSVYQMIPAIFRAKAATKIAAGADFDAESGKSQKLSGFDRCGRCHRRGWRRARQPRLPTVVPRHQIGQCRVHRVHRVVRGLVPGDLLRVHPQVAAFAGGCLSGQRRSAGLREHGTRQQQHTTHGAATCCDTGDCGNPSMSRRERRVRADSQWAQTGKPLSGNWDRSELERLMWRTWPERLLLHRVRVQEAAAVPVRPRHLRTLRLPGGKTRPRRPARPASERGPEVLRRDGRSAAGLRAPAERARAVALERPPLGSAPARRHPPAARALGRPGPRCHRGFSAASAQAWHSSGD